MSFWNPFRRPKAPPPPPPSDDLIDEREMNEDWAPGDLAECISDNWPQMFGVQHPRKGDVLRVSEVTEGRDCIFGHLIYCLGFEGRGRYSWDCRSFRKLRPVLEPAEQQWTAWLKDKLRQPAEAR